MSPRPFSTRAELEHALVHARQLRSDELRAMALRTWAAARQALAAALDVARRATAAGLVLRRR